MMVITAPAGDTGHQVLGNVLASDRPVRVIVRDPARLPTSIRNRAGVSEGSHSGPVVVTRAFTGADAVFWLVPPDSHAASVDEAYVEFTRPAAEAVRSHHVGRVVDIPALGRARTSLATPGS